MSLIITSSKQDRYSNEELDIEKPYSYKNHLSNTMTIPPHSKVAVHSVKLSRTSNWVFRDDSNIAYFAFGQQYTDNDNILTETNLAFQRMEVPDGTYSHDGVAVALTKALSLVYNSHPDTILPSVVVLKDGTKFAGFTITTALNSAVKAGVELVDGAGGAYSDEFFPRPLLDTRGGETIVATNTKEVGADTFNTSTWVMEDGSMPNDDDLFDATYVPDIWDSSDFTLYGPDIADAQGGGDAYVGGILPQYPISHQLGVFQFSPPFTQTEAYLWHAALTRECAAGRYKHEQSDDWETDGEYNHAVPPYADEGDRTAPDFYLFGDYWVGCRYNATGGTAESGGYELQCGYFGHERGSQGATLGDPTNINSALSYRWENAYWDATGQEVYSVLLSDGSTKIPYDWEANANEITKFKFGVDGEKVSLQAYGDFGGIANEWKDVMGGTITDCEFPPINSMRWSLYPKILVENTASEPSGTNSLQIEKFTGRDMALTNSLNGISEAGEWFSNSLYGRTIRADTQIAYDLDRRPTNDPTYPYDALSCNVNDLLDMSPQIVIGPSPNITPQTEIDTPFPKMKSVLGFQEDVLSSANGTATAAQGKYVWESPETPLTGGQGGTSLFVACPQLTAQSYNFGKGAPSQILYQIPQFDNTGSDQGALYFEAHEKTYLNLGNTEKIELDQLDINIVDRNEKYATELDGTTIVVLHIK